MLVGRKATCSVSAKKLSGLRLSVMRADRCGPAQVVLGNDLGRIQHVIGLRCRRTLRRTPGCPDPIRERRRVDRFEQIAAHGNRGRLLQSSRPRPRSSTARPSRGFQWNLTKVEALPARIDQRKVWTPKPSIVRRRAREWCGRHGPHQHVGRFGHQADEVPEGVVRRGGLRIALVGLHLHRMDEVGEFDRVLDEEDRNVVADEIPIAFRV